MRERERVGGREVVMATGKGSGFRKREERSDDSNRKRKW